VFIHSATFSAEQQVHRGFFNFNDTTTTDPMADELVNSFLPLSRKFFEHRFWKESREFSKAEAWIDMLREARWSIETGKAFINGKHVIWERGQWPVSYRFLAERWGWSTKKVGNYLDFLEAEGGIKKETQKETGQTIITLCNYDVYNPVSKNGKQQLLHEGNTEETLRKQQGNETNKENKVNKVKKKNGPLAPVPMFPDEKEQEVEYDAILKTENIKERFALLRDFIEGKRPRFPAPYVYLWNLFAKKHGLKGVHPELTSEKRRKFLSRINEKRFDFVRILHTLEKESTWRLGDNQRGWKVDWNYIFKSEENYCNILDERTESII
jgi:hypothetical protein